MATMNATIAGSTPSNNHETDEVHIALRLNMKERLMTLTYTSSINLVASRDHPFTSDHFNSLRRFNGFIRNDYTNLFPRISRPILDLFLVSLRSTAVTKFPGRPEVRICVGGLRSQQEIVHFHQVLTQPHLRVHSNPLKLCFNRALVELTGAEILHTVLVSSDSNTLCGGLLHSFTSGDSTPKQKSTIGGMVEVNGTSYAVTIIHNKKQHSLHSGEEASANNARFASEETLIETEHHAYLEPPLAIDRWDNVSELSEWGSTAMGVNEASNAGGNRTMEVQWSPRDEEIISLDGWALIPVPAKYKRPNINMTPTSTGTEPVADYITRARYVGFPTKLPVSIIPGVSQKKLGMLSQQISFLVQEDGTSHEVWTVGLPRNEALQRGDSGSWVVDHANKICIGSVTATSPGVAYIVPFSDFFEKVRMRYGKSATVSMPVPFTTFCNLLQDTSMRARYLDQAISERSLEASPGDRVAQRLLPAITAGRADLVTDLLKQESFDYAAIERRFANTNPRQPLTDDYEKVHLPAERITSYRRPQAQGDAQAFRLDVGSSTAAEPITAPSMGQRIRGKVSRMLSRGPNSKQRSSKIPGFGKPKDGQQEDITGKQQSQDSSGGAQSSAGPGKGLPPAPQLPYTPPMQPLYPGATSYPHPVYAQAISPYQMSLPTPPQMQQSPAAASAPYLYPPPVLTSAYELSGTMSDHMIKTGEQPLAYPHDGTVQPVPVHEMGVSPPPNQGSSSPHGIQPRKDGQQ